MILVLLSRLSHPWIDSTLVSNFSECSVTTLMFFGPVSPEDLWDVDIINKIGQEGCSSLGSLVSHGECSGALAVSDAMKQCVAPKGFVSHKEQIHVQGASKPSLV